MESEFGGLYDEPLQKRPAANPRHGRRSAQHEQGAAGASVEELLTPQEVGSAAVGDEQIAELEQKKAVQQELVALDAAFYDDYGVKLDASSRAGFLCFMRYSSGAAAPLLGAESTGHLIATWVAGEECLSVRFLDRYRLNYAVAANTEHGLQRRWGTAHALTFLDQVPEAKRLAFN